MYKMILGTLVKEHGSWNIDGMREACERRFDTYEAAKSAYEAYDVRDDFETLWNCSAVKPKERGFYAELAKADSDGAVESLQWKQWTAEDHLSAQANEETEDDGGGGSKRRLLIEYRCWKLSLGMDTGWYQGTIPELNVRKFKTDTKLEHLNFERARNILDVIESTSGDVGVPICAGRLCAVTPEREAELIMLNEVWAKIDEKNEFRGVRDALLARIDLYKRAVDPPATRDEARKLRREWNLAHNEGGEGYEPHFVSREEYEDALNELRGVESRIDEIESWLSDLEADGKV